ncbi:MAG: hypothetical protein Q8S03_08445 [Brevundimonas sp.]|uniref:hypothetical protein n=1 Tax=Brevundimonas sp. TaxID=1871086 RepID=UPI002733CFEB|nr:hypothetical protein [Brevundimonas sp.]MDP3404705.1 hypothetical protein [Brevundimonas sp.]
MASPTGAVIIQTAGPPGLPQGDRPVEADAAGRCVLPGLISKSRPREPGDRAAQGSPSPGSDGSTLEATP